MNRIDFAAGFVVFIIGLLAFAKSTDYIIGSLSNMGPGFFPMALSSGMMFLGAVMLVKSFVGKHTQKIIFHTKSLFLILASIVVFAVLLTKVGLLVSLTSLIFIAALADQNSTFKETSLLIVVLAFFSILIFVALLDVAVPIVKWN